MKNIKALVATSLLAIGIITLGLANVAGIGYGLYLWGGVGMAFGVAAWTAFKLWLMMIAGGIVVIALGYLFEELAKD